MPSISLCSQITTVKNGILNIDKGITIGKAFDSYKHVTNGKWKVINDDRGRTYVEFRAQYKNESLVNNTINGLVAYIKDFKNHQNDFITFLNEARFRLDFVVQFLVDADGKGFQTSFIGFEDEEHVMPATRDDRFSRVYSNQPLGLFPEDMYRYFFKCFILLKLDLSKLCVATPMDSFNFGVLDKRVAPIALFSPQKFLFDEDKLVSTIVVDYAITNLTQQSGNITTALNNGEELFTEVFSRKGQYDVLQRGTLSLKSRTDDKNYNTFRFFFTG